MRHRREVSRSRRWLTRIGIAASTLAVLTAAVVSVIRIRFHGENLAGFVETTLNEQIRGRVEIGTIEWPLSSLPRAATGGWLPVTIRGIEVYDEFGTLVLRAGEARGEIQTLPLALGPDFHFRNIIIPRAREGDEPNYVLLRSVREPYPATPYDTSVVSIVSAFYPERSRSLGAGLSASSSPVFDLQSYRFSGVDVEFDFGDTFRARARDVSGAGMLRSDPRDPLTSKLYYSLAPTAREVRFESGPVAVELRDFEVQRLAQIAENWPADSEPSSLRWLASGTTTDGARVSISGAMLDHWNSFYGGDYDIRVDAHNIGTLAGALTSDLGRGEKLHVGLSVDGPRVAPTIGLELDNLELHPRIGNTELPVELEHARAEFNLATDSGRLADTVARVGGGQVHLSAHLSLTPLTFDVEVDIPEPVDLSPLIPPGTLTRVMGKPELSGSLHTFGTRDLQDLDQLDLKLGRVGITGRVFRRGDGELQIPRVEVALGRSRVSITGDIYPAEGYYDLAVDGRSRDLDRWLKVLGAPAVAGTADGTAHVSGRFDNPTITAGLALGRVPLVSAARTRLSYRGGELSIADLSSTALGGKLDGKATISLTGRPVVRDAEVRGEGLDLSKLPHVGALFTGRGDIELSASGPAERIRARANVDLSEWSFAGDRYDDTRIALTSDQDGSQSLELHLVRQLGGKLDLAAFLGRSGALGGVMSMRKLPLETLTTLQGKDDPEFGAAVDAELQLSGSLSRPTADGQVRLHRSWLGEAFLGDAALDLNTRPDGRLGFSGRFFQDSLVVEGSIKTVPPFDVELRADLRRVEIDRLWPTMRTEWNSRGWVSGKLEWSGPLIPVADRPPRLHLELTDAVMIVDSENARGRPAPLRLKSRTPLSLTVVGERFELDREVVVVGPTGEFSLSGSGTAEALDLDVDGAVSIAVLEPYFRSQFDRLDGTVRARARVTGPLDSPRLSGTVELSEVSVKPAGQDTRVMIPAGKIEFTNDQLSITGVSMVVEDEFSSERSVLNISGGVKLVDFEPRLWAVQIDGQLAGKMLLVASPEAFSSATGVADLSIALSGAGRAPDIDGRIDFNDKNPLSLVPRTVRREITLTEGALAFTDQLVELESIRGWLDDEGRITDVSGEIGLQDWSPIDGCIAISARDVPFRVPEVLDLSLGVQNVSICGHRDRGLEISGGRIEVVDGRYIQKWKQAVDLIKPQRTVETGPSILESNPLLASAKIDDLRVSTRAFFVKNNVANLELSGDVTITGTPKSPRLDGLIRVEQGTFKFQGIRPTFSRTSGSLWFSRLKEFPEQTPRLEVRSESDYRDTTGQDHLIILELSGPLSNLVWDLKTSAGLNKAQTLNLVLVGRTIDDTRAALGDAPIAKVGEFTGVRTTQQVDGGSIAVADEFFKSISGDFLSSLVADPIRNLTNIDIVKLRLGATGTINLYLEENFTRSVRGIGEYERSSRGSTLTGRVQYRVTDRISGDYEYLRQQYDDDAELDIDRQRLKFTYRLPIIP